MKNSVITTVLVQFVQNSKKGEITVNARPIVIESNNLQDVAGTVVKRVLDARMMMAKYNGKIEVKEKKENGKVGDRIGNFSFSRKFNMRISINGGDAVDFNDMFGWDDVDCSRTVIVDKADSERTKKVLSNFAVQIFDLVRLSMSNEWLEIESFDSVVKSIPSKVSEVSSPKQLAESK